MLEPVNPSTPPLTAYFAKCAAGCELKHSILVSLLSWMSEEKAFPVSCMAQASSLLAQAVALKKTYRTLLAAASVHDSNLCGFCVPRMNADENLEQGSVGPLISELTFLLHHPADYEVPVCEEDNPLMTHILDGMDLVCSRLDLLIERTLDLFDQNESLSIFADVCHSPIYSLA